MKLHQLARHQAFSGGSNEQRELSPLARQQQAASMQHLKQQVASMSDDEEDEFGNEPSAFFDSIESHQNNNHHQHQDQQLHQHHQLNLNQHQQMGHQSSTNQLDSSGFLIDKNKKLFPQKLWELIHNPSIQHCLRWSQDGQRVYLNRNEFEAYYLKTPNNQFHTQKAISFVRQMNMYGFRKVDDCYYENDNFRRDRQHLLRNMIRRHPNKGLFVGLDHHQLAAAAAAQQAIQVNQQLQQLEHQHKHRTEQALRLNSYLNSHQFHQSAAMAAHHHHQLQHSSAAAFKQMSSQIVAQAVAANHLSQQRQQQLHQHQQHLQHLQHQQATSTLDLASSPQPQQQPPVNHQPKKSRLLNNFYASNNATSEQLGMNPVPGTGNALVNHQQRIHSPDSMRSTTSSVDSPPSQCSSLVNSGSAGSPQPVIGSALMQNKLASSQQQPDNLGKIRQQALESLQAKLNGVSKVQLSDALPLIQNGPTDLSASRQALHQTLVRSLLQLKNQNSHDQLASLQQQQHLLQHQNSQRSLLESLASLSSVGTGSNVDPASNSPTEQTSTPPSTPSSPQPTGNHSVEPFSQLAHHFCSSNDDNSMVLNLAKSSSNHNTTNNHFNGLNNISALKQTHKQELACDKSLTVEEMDYEKNYEGEETEIEEDEEFDDDDDDECSAATKQEVSKKVRSYLNNQMKRVGSEPIDGIEVRVKQEELKDLTEEKGEQEEVDDEQEYSHKRKRAKATTNSTSSSSTSFSQEMDDESANINSITRSLIMELCDRRGDILNAEAIEEAALYTECFLGILLGDASSIARHSALDEQVTAAWDSSRSGDSREDKQDEEEDKDRDKNNRTAIVDTSSLCLALKLVPSKLIDVIQQQVAATTCIKIT